MQFSKITEEILIKAGWYSGRKIDISNCLEYYQKRNLHINDTIEKFLEEFTGLKIVYPRYRDANFVDEFEINYEAAMYYPEDTREYFKLRTGEDLVPIGYIAGRHMTAFMSDTGKIYETDGDFLAKLGDDYISAFETLCHRKDREIIEDIYDDDDE